MVKHSQTTDGKSRADARRDAPPGEDAGTLTDEEYLSAGGPDALDAATSSPETPGGGASRRDEERRDERTDDSIGAGHEAHADSPPPAPRGAIGEDPERVGATDPG